jgi:hypothetical protein
VNLKTITLIASRQVALFALGKLLGTRLPTILALDLKNFEALYN